MQNRIKYPLTDDAKEIAKELVALWDNKPENQLWNYTARWGDGKILTETIRSAKSGKLKQVSGSVLRELSKYGLVQIVWKTSDSFELLLLQELQNAVQANFKFEPETKTNKSGMHSIFGEPILTSQFQCDIFMVMPFAEKFRPIYDDHIMGVVKKLNLGIKRGDDVFSKHDIMRDIWSLTCNARLIIADCTGKNPNVFYEMGLAHALDKPIIMITQAIEDIPFDIRSKRIIVYDYTPRGMDKFESELEIAIQRILGDEN